MTYVNQKSREQIILQDVITKFGCIQREQIYELFKTLPRERVDLQVIHFLRTRKIIKSIEDRYFVDPTKDQALTKIL